MLDEPPFVFTEEEPDIPEEYLPTSPGQKERVREREEEIQRTIREKLLRIKEEEEKELKIVRQHPLEIKLEEGLLQLFQIIDDSNESVSNVRIAAIKAELERQVKDKEERIKLETMVEEKAKIAYEEYQKIDEQWEKIKRMKDPLNIHNETNLQREKCEALLQQRDTVIELLKDTLQDADKNFIKELKQQGEEIDILVDRCEQQILVMKEAYMKQLEALEKMIDLEKEELLRSNRENWEEAVEKRDEIAKQGVIDRYEISRRHAADMNKTIFEQHEQLRAIKIDLQQHLSKMKIEVDQLKTVCALNVEKLNYNYLILSKRVEENRIIKAQNKRLNNRLYDYLNTLTKKSRNRSINLIMKIAKYSQELKNIHKYVSVLDKRGESLAENNVKKYFQLWDFNQKAAEELIQKILDGDKILHEQILGVPWNPPEEISIPKESLPSYQEGVKKYQGSLIRMPKVLRRDTVLSAEEEKRRDRLIRLILDRIADTCGFLLDSNVKKQIKWLAPNKQNLVKVDNLFEALDIKNNSDVEYISKYFLPYVYCASCDKAKEEGETEKQTDDLTKETTSKSAEPSCDSFIEACDSEYQLLKEISDRIKSHVDLINEVVYNEVKEFPDEKKLIARVYGGDRRMSGTTPRLVTIKDEDKSTTTDEANYMIICMDSTHKLSIEDMYVTKALKNFMVDFYAHKALAKDKSMDAILNRDRITIHRCLDPKEVTDYWNKFSNVFSQEKVELWDVMIKGIKDYYDALQRRHRLNVEIKKLKQNNYELRRLLQRYIQDSKQDSRYKGVFDNVQKELGLN